MTLHTLPGNIPGLLRPGSPVFARCLEMGDIPWIVQALNDSYQGLFVWISRPPKGCTTPISIEQMARDLALNLDDTTGFLHAKEWLWRACSSKPPGPQLHWHNAGSGRWFLSNPESALAFDIATLDPIEALRTACWQKVGL